MPPPGEDIEKLLKKHPKDPRIGQGFNDARGDFEDSDLHADYKNRKNHTGKEQKKRRDPDVGVVQAPETTKPEKAD